MDTKIISHRGRTKLGSPDNTVHSITDAIDLKVDMVEFDVRRTKDRQLICFHDAQIEGKLVGDILFSDIAEINPVVPTLEQILWTAKGKIEVDVELKESGYEEEVISMVKDYFGYDHFIMKSFDRDVVKRIKEIDSRIFTGLLLGEEWSLPQFIEVLKESFTGSGVSIDGADFLSPNSKIVEIGLMERLRKKQIPIQVWTVNDEKLLEKLISENIHSVVTDIPERAMEIRESLRNV